MLASMYLYSYVFPGYKNKQDTLGHCSSFVAPPGFSSLHCTRFSQIFREQMKHLDLSEPIKLLSYFSFGASKGLKHQQKSCKTGKLLNTLTSIARGATFITR